jgi:hypothetical protein
MAVKVSGGIRERVELLAWLGLGMVFVVAGIACLGYYFWVTNPARLDADIVSARAKVTSQTSQPAGWGNTNYFPISQLTYREAFAFTDRSGLARVGEDEVSAVYFAAHPVGAEITVYYYPERPDRAVIDVRTRLAQGPISNLGLLGTFGLLGGLFMALSHGRRLWLMRAVARPDPL